MKTKENLSKIIKKEFSIDNFSFEEVSDKGDAAVFIVKIKNKKYIVRIIDEIEESFSLENNIFALKKLKSIRIAPKIISIGKIGGVKYSIESFLKGEKKEEIEDLSYVLKTVKKLHSIKSKSCGYILQRSENWEKFIKKKFIFKYEGKIKEMFSKGKEVFEYLLNNVPDCMSFSLLHGDFSKYNLLFFKKNCFMFDFEDCYYGEKELDFGFFYYFSEEINEKDWEKIAIAGYDKDRILYYALCVAVAKACSAKPDSIEKRIKRLKEVWNLQKGGYLKE